MKPRQYSGGPPMTEGGETGARKGRPADGGYGGEAGERDRTTGGNREGGPRLTVEHAIERSGEPHCEQCDGRAGDDLVGPELHDNQGETGGDCKTGEDRRGEPDGRPARPRAD